MRNFCAYVCLLLLLNFKLVRGGVVPFFRYYNSRIADHFYTRNFQELWFGRGGWKFERVECRIHSSPARGTVPLYRYWGNRDHFYTTNKREIGTVVPGQVGKYGFRSEGVAGYCYPRYRSGLIPLYRFYHAGLSNHFYTTSYREGRHYNFEGVACYVYRR